MSSAAHVVERVSQRRATVGAVAKGALRPGALSELHKELIALAIGVATHCDGCIGFHVTSLVRLGVKCEEVIEALGVAMCMGGGPSLMYAAEALHAYDEFARVPDEAWSPHAAPSFQLAY